MHFTKMQGLGNDYVYVNLFEETVTDPPALSRKISDRHLGVGSDGLVLIGPSEVADFRMQMFNADGSEAEMCGNASRCVGKYVYERGLTSKTDLSLETGSGIRRMCLETDHNGIRSVSVDMGVPHLDAAEIPTKIAASGQVIDRCISVGDRKYKVTCVSMGNPHAVIFVENADAFPVTDVGPTIENSALFPQRTNVEFATVYNRQYVRMRVWERGSGETMACGTGACATLVACVLNGKTDAESAIQLNGGCLQVSWDQKTGHVFQTGPASFVFDGNFPAD